MTNALNWLATLVACAGMAFVASSCAGVASEHKAPPCVSHCGMLLENVGNGAVSCETIDQAEQVTINAMNELCGDDPRLCKKNACESLFGWQIEASEYTVGSSNGSEFYVGYSQCASKQMWIAANDTWRHGSLPHEMVHAMQHCHPPSHWKATEEDNHGKGHEGWTDHGVYGRLQEIKRGLR